MSIPRKPPPTFEVAFDGKGIYPEGVSLGYLSRAFSAVQRLATGQDTGDEDESGGLQDGKIGLLQVRRGSAVYQMMAPIPALALANLREAGEVLERPEAIGDREFVLSPVEELSSIARSMKSGIVIREPGRVGAVLARIGPDSYSSLSQKLLIVGESAITGKVERVGGATERKCGLRVRGQVRMLFCKVESDNAVRSLGQKLYEKVTAHGTATWLRTSWRVVAFTIREVFQPKLKQSAELISSLRDAGGSDWDSISDPESFLDEVNGKR